jgi:adenylate kinase family enzyme
MINHYNRIIIVGDAGRGKSTFAKKLSKKLNIKHYCTDDFFYIAKFSVINDKEKSVEQIAEVYKHDKWIMEGTTRRLIEGGLEKAEVTALLWKKCLNPIKIK